MNTGRATAMGWWRRADTLALRLFILIWLALVFSHIAAYIAVRAAMSGSGPPGPGAGPPQERAPPDATPRRPLPPAPAQEGSPRQPHHGSAHPLPTFPSLPPTPGVPGQASAGGQGRGAPALPQGLLVLDYGMRLLLIGAAAWWGSRWLARPVKRLVDASQALGPTLAKGDTPQRLQEDDGTAEVRLAADVFNQMAQQIQQQFQSRALMVSAISHDLRTPLTRMRLRVETADLPAPQRERFVSDLRDMNALIDTAFEVFRSTGGAPNLIERTDATALVQALVDDRTEAGAQVTLAAIGAHVLSTDVLALRRVVGNLIDNALRYAGHAEVTLRVGPEQVTHADSKPGRSKLLYICIADRGPGIPPDQLLAVLQPFVRLEASRHGSTGGTGLGLFIAQELTQRLGGTLSLQNREGGGLLAQLSLPLRD